LINKIEIYNLKLYIIIKMISTPELNDLVKNIYLCPTSVSKDIYSILHTYIKQNVIGKTDNRYGEILSLEKINKIDGIILDNGSRINWQVNMRCYTIKPFIDQVIEFYPKSLCENGILGVLEYDKFGSTNIQIFISGEYLYSIGYSYIKEEDRFVNKENRITLLTNIKAKIINISQEFKGYKCICNLA
jgi:DNA-directed RNA polymerase subunit E'/Rpb7